MASFNRESYAFNILRKAVKTPNVSVMLLSGDEVSLDTLLTSSRDMDSEVVYYSDALLENMETSNVEIVHVSRYLNTLLVDTNVDDRKLKIKFNTTPIEYEGITSSREYPTQVSQAIVAFHTGSAELTGSTYTVFMLCSVGLYGSGADLEVNDLNVGVDSKLHFSDLTLTF